MSLTLVNPSVKLSATLTVEIPTLTIEKGQHTIISGLNGSGKSVLAAVLA